MTYKRYAIQREMVKEARISVDFGVKIQKNPMWFVGKILQGLSNFSVLGAGG